MIPIQVKLKVSEDKPISLKVSTNLESVGMSLSAPFQIIDGTKYEGEYTVTPSSEKQVLSTENLQMKYNVTINPIPSNYGLITWNGSNLMVS